jgi:hypothetical protein
MTEEEVKAVFLLSGLKVNQFYKIENKYWPDAYVEQKKNDPWWLAQTEFGMIEIGWRKRVISIDWTNTGMKLKNLPNEGFLGEQGITSDDTTKWPGGIHAWGYSKAVEYLHALKVRLQQFQYTQTPEGQERLRRDKELAEEIANRQANPNLSKEADFLPINNSKGE